MEEHARLPPPVDGTGLREPLSTLTKARVICLVPMLATNVTAADVFIGALVPAERG